METRWWKNSTSMPLLQTLCSPCWWYRRVCSLHHYIIISFFLLHPSSLLDVCIFFQSIQQTTDRASKSDLSGHQKSLSGSFRYLLSTEFLCHIYLYVDTHGKSAVGTLTNILRNTCWLNIKLYTRSRYRRAPSTVEYGRSHLDRKPQIWNTALETL